MTRWSSALECRILSCSLLCGGVSRSWGTAAEVGGMREEQEMAAGAGAVMLYHTAAPRGLELKNTNQEAFVSVEQQDSCIYSRFFLKQGQEKFLLKSILPLRLERMWIC